MFRIYSFIAVLLMALNVSAAGVSARLDSLFNSRYTPDSPGAQFLVAVGDSIIYENARGVADFSTGARIDADTRFNIASISKQFTAISVLNMANMGLLTIDDCVLKYFPDFDATMFAPITLRHLMSHTSGIPDTRPRDNRNWMLTVTDSESIDYMFSLKKGKFPPGTAYDYINPTYQLLYAIIERLSGRSFVDYQRDNLFIPAGMRSTFYFDASETHSNVAHGYVKEDAEASADRDVQKETVYADAGFADTAGCRWHEYDYGEETFFATKADGGIYSSARDLLAWEHALAGAEVVDAESLRVAYTPHIEVTGSEWCSYQNRPFTSYGLGFFIDNTPGRPVKVYHTGDNGGFQAYLAKYPSCNVVVVLLENRNDFDRWSFAQKVDEILKEGGILTD